MGQTYSTYSQREIDDVIAEWHGLHRVTFHKLLARFPRMDEKVRERLLQSAVAARDELAFSQRFGNVNNITKDNFIEFLALLTLPEKKYGLFRNSKEFIEFADKMFTQFHISGGSVMSRAEFRNFSAHMRTKPAMNYVANLDFTGMARLATFNFSEMNYIKVMMQMRYLHDMYDVQKFHNFEEPGTAVDVENEVWDTICLRHFLNPELPQDQCEFIRLPVVDWTAPTSQQVELVLTNMASCPGSAAHCSAGYGRTGAFILAALGCAMGVKTMEEAEKLVKSKYSNDSADELTNIRKLVQSEGEKIHQGWNQFIDYVINLLADSTSECTHLRTLKKRSREVEEVTSSFKRYKQTFDKCGVLSLQLPECLQMLQEKCATSGRVRELTPYVQRALLLLCPHAAKAEDGTDVMTSLKTTLPTSSVTLWYGRDDSIRFSLDFEDSDSFTFHTWSVYKNGVVLKTNLQCAELPSILVETLCHIMNSTTANSLLPSSVTWDRLETSGKTVVMLSLFNNNVMFPVTPSNIIENPGDQRLTASYTDVGEQVEHGASDETKDLSHLCEVANRSWNKTERKAIRDDQEEMMKMYDVLNDTGPSHNEIMISGEDDEDEKKEKWLTGQEEGGREKKRRRRRRSKSLNDTGPSQKDMMISPEEEEAMWLRELLEGDEDEEEEKVA